MRPRAVFSQILDVCLRVAIRMLKMSNLVKFVTKGLCKSVMNDVIIFGGNNEAE